MNTDDKKYGIPELKKFPMPDADHVRSAIRFFNYVSPKYEKQLAKAIIARMKEYGLTFDDFTVGDNNRFSKYIPKDELKHHGILGMHWGVRRFQNADGSLTSAGKKRYGNGDYTIESGKDLYRISSNSNGYNDSSNRVYASTNKSDHKKWTKFYDKYSNPSSNLYDVRMKTVREIQVASETTLGEKWMNKMLSDKKFAKQTVSDMIESAERHGLDTNVLDVTDLTYERFSKTLGYHTKSGDAFLDDMRKSGYGAIEDVYGKNTAKNPVIILDPQSNIQRESVNSYRRKYR